MTKKAENNIKQKKEMNSFHIVGIGASAGGLAVFETFFSGMPVDKSTGMAFVLIQHLSPEYKSMLPEIMKPHTKMPVYEVEDGMSISPENVYIMPPNKDMAIINGRLQLMDRVDEKGLHLPIDFFFRSLAQDQGDRAIGIILSGTGSDGTLGLIAIKGVGGICIVQDPKYAEFNGMPSSAVAAGVADFILKPAEMAKKLISCVEMAEKKIKVIRDLPIHDIENSIEKIFVILRSKTGHDFTMYKRNTIVRRIERRMAVNQVEKISDYVLYLQKNKKEVELLFKDMLIGVTNFFRDAEAFVVLYEKAVEQICLKKSSEDTVRVWVPGCSTGEEAYSIAILFKEKLEELKQNCQVQIFATDIDSFALATARGGYYPIGISADVSKERLEKYFTANDNGSFQIKKIIRDMLIFSEQNYTKDPPFSRMDLISCRNSLIYMTGELQKKVFPMFHYALIPEGFLLLGTSESLGEFGDLFNDIDRKYKLYQKKPGKKNDIMPRMESFINLINKGDAIAKKHSESIIERKTNVREIAEQSILKQFAPAFVVVNEKKEIVYVSGRTGKYLEPAQGDISINIIDMAREGLGQELTTALHKVISTGIEKVLRENILVKTNGEFTNVNLTIHKIDTGLFIVIFEDGTQNNNNMTKPNVELTESSGESGKRIVALERELALKEEYIKSILEEKQASNEEMKSANEEMQSGNEELQATNEELLTSKEELQSLNEELATVNNELQIKVVDLSKVNNDMNNLFAGTGVGTIFVDLQMNIQRFTPNATKVINLIKTDIGRALEHTVSNLVGYEALIEDTQDVIDTLIPKEIEVQTKSGVWYLMRILPYRTITNAIEGAVITFVDITEMKKAHEILKENEALKHLAVVVKDAYDAVVVQSLEGQILKWNPMAEKIYGWSEDEAVKMNIRDIVPAELRDEVIKRTVSLANSKVLEPFHTQRITKNGKTVEVWLTATALANEKNEIYAVATTERKFEEGE